jgi:DNA-binding MarR family transcriptional regulator
MAPELRVPGPALGEEPPLEQLIAQFIRAAGIRLAAADIAPAAIDIAPAAVSRSEARALFELLAARGIAQGELAGLLGLEKSTVSRLAASLERKGWVRRGRDTGNQRYVRLYLTDDGRSVAARLWRGWHDRQARILGSLSEEERTGLALGLRGLVRAICEDAADGEADPAG